MRVIGKVNQILIITIVLISWVNVYGNSGLTHKKLEYSNLLTLNKISQSELLSDIIDVPLKNSNPFLAVGFQANIKSIFKNAKIFLRSSSDKLTWTEWQLMVNEFQGENEKANFLAELLFFDKNTKYIQFKSSSDTKIESIVFNFISPGASNLTQNESVLSKEYLEFERPNYVSRKEWNCPQDEHVNSRTLTNVTHLIIHHSAGNTTSSDFPAVVLAYWDYHVNGHGWDDIGYNWLVDPNGVLYKGRAWKSETQENVQGAHNSGKNGNTSGICLIGNYMSSTPSEKGLDKLASICAFLCNKFEIDPLGESYHASINKSNDNISGHGQSGGGTSCPGTQLINRMQTVREITNSKNYDITAAPSIISSYPSVEHDSVYLSKDIVIEFSHPMNKVSVESAFIISPEVSGEFSWNDEGRILNFNPSPELLAKTNYNLTISQECKSKWDIHLDDKIELDFVTKARDNLSLISNYPTDGSVDVARDVTIELVFDGPINGNSLGGNIFFRDSDSTDVYLTVDGSGYKNGIIRFSPYSSLEENSSYHIELRENISSTDNYFYGKSKIINFTTGTITSIEDDKLVSNKLILSQNYPNPFNPTTQISYSLPNVASSFSLRKVTLKVYDVLGKEVKTLVDKNQPAGKYNVNFDAASIPSGVYYYQLKAGNFVETKKMNLLK